MVIDAKMAIQSVPSKGRISIIKIQNFTIEKRQSVVRIVYGLFMVITGLTLAVVDPIDIFTKWYMDVKEGSFVFTMWENPTYRVYTEVWAYNYTNVQEYLDGQDTVMKVQEVGPFRYEEIRNNRNMTLDEGRGVLSLVPNITLTFLPEESIAHTKDVHIMVPNIALVAISTLAADKLGYFANAGAYYSITALGSKLFRNITIEEFFWGYHDPLVTLASRILPGWIDFKKIGILDRFYAKRTDTVEMELKDQKRRFSINSWNGSPGLEEQGYTSPNTSTLCNRIQGSYEGLMVSPNLSKESVIPIFRKQACRIYPFTFHKEIKGKFGFNYYSFRMAENSFNKTSPYACKCKEHCLPDGFVDVSTCYYGFPIALSKPHFLDADPEQQSFYEGMHPDPEKDASHLDIEPTLGVPISLASNIQVNIASRTSPANPITKPLKDKVLPLLWVSMYCKELPPNVLGLLRLRFVIAPPLIITVEVVLFILGFILGTQGFYRILKPKYQFIPKIESKQLRRLSNVVINMTENIGFKDNEDLAKEAVSLLAIKEDGGLENFLSNNNNDYDCDLDNFLNPET